MLGDLSSLRQTKNLEAATIGENRSGPARKLVEFTQGGHRLVPRPQGQMISIGQNDLRAGLLDALHVEPLHSTQGTNRHKGRQVDRPARRMQSSPPRRRLSVSMMQIKAKGVRIVAIFTRTGGLRIHTILQSEIRLF